MAIKDIVANMSHLHTIMSVATDAFSSGKSWQKGEDPTAPYKKMMDEAIDVNTYRLLRQRLEAEGIDVDSQYQETARYFQEHPFFVDAWRENLAAISDAQARVENLREFVLADGAEKDLLCQQIDQRHPAARALYNHLINAKAVWKRVFSRELTLDQARNMRVWLASLTWLQKDQFQHSIGALTSTDDRRDCLSEVLAAYPDLNQMWEIATARGLIKEPGQIEKTTKQLGLAIKKLATPRPNDPAETAVAQAEFNAAQQQLRQTLNQNPLARLSRLFR